MVITNGKLLNRMQGAFWENLDVLQLSIYPGLDPEIADYARSRCSDFGKAFHSTTYTEFHQQLRAEPNDGQHFATCHWRRDCYSVGRGHFFLCPQSIYFPEAFMGLGKTVDGLHLDGLTQEVFDAFLERKDPLNACRICCANEMKSKPWAEAKGREEWVKASTQAP